MTRSCPVWFESWRRLLPFTAAPLHGALRELRDDVGKAWDANPDGVWFVAESTKSPRHRTVGTLGRNGNYFVT